jgi:hypothetical protein
MVTGSTRYCASMYTIFVPKDFAGLAAETMPRPGHPDKTRQASAVSMAMTGFACCFVRDSGYDMNVLLPTDNVLLELVQNLSFLIWRKLSHPNTFVNIIEIYI